MTAPARMIAPWWRRALAHIRDRVHQWSGCEMHVINTPEGIGGQCIWCGRIEGWMTSAELRAAYRPRS